VQILVGVDKLGMNGSRPCNKVVAMTRGILDSMPAPQVRLTIPFGQDGRASAIVDINGDGKLDILTAGFNGTVSVLFGNGEGTFASGTSLAFAFGTELQIADVNDFSPRFQNDGRLDPAISGSLNQFIPSPCIVLLQTRLK
jgi:FG-GAP-like repeat